MHYKKILVALLFMSILFNCKEDEKLTTEALIIPQPVEQIVNQGQFILNSSTGINYDDTFKVSAGFLKSFIQEGSNMKLEGKQGVGNKAWTFIDEIIVN